MQDYQIRTYKFDEEFDQLLGETDAPNTILCYLNFTSALSRDFMMKVFPQIRKNYIYTGQAVFVLREVYFDQAGLLAGAMLRTLPKEKYFSAVEKLFIEQDIWTTGSSTFDIANQIADIGTRVGGDIDIIMSAMNDNDLEQSIMNQSLEHVDDDDVQNTPTLFVNNQRPTDWAFTIISEFID